MYNIGQPGSSISSYMAQMDKELANTSLGSSFVKKHLSDKDKPKVYSRNIIFSNGFLNLIYFFLENCENRPHSSVSRQ